MSLDLPCRPSHRPQRPSTSSAYLSSFINHGEATLLTYVSGSTFIFGMEPLNFISFLPTVRQPLTASIRFLRPYVSMVLLSMEACDTNVMEVLGTKVFRIVNNGTLPSSRQEHTANIGRMMIGSTLGIDALGSPWCQSLVLDHD